MSQAISIVRQKLETGCDKLSLKVDEASLDKLIDYLLLMQKWNAAYNLTAITELNEMLVKHLLDSLAVAPFIEGTDFLDVGAGAGLPGIPLAILFPEKQFYLVEPNAKKCNFLELVRIRLSLNNLFVCKSRIEEFHEAEHVDGVLSRAFTQIEPLFEKTKKFLNDGGYILAMKGGVFEEELEGLPEHVNVITKPLRVPYLDAERHVVLIKES